MEEEGTYQLILDIAKETKVTVGALGTFDFSPGTYIYTGRAKRGLQARLHRHALRRKRRHWHIDYLTTHPGIQLLNAAVISRHPGAECTENRKLLKNKSNRVPVRGFGSSDCRNGCPGHLVQLGALPKTRGG
ncbi:MAG: DUF123 domain-containing protein [Fidelibacterota bacterium]